MIFYRPKVFRHTDEATPPTLQLRPLSWNGPCTTQRIHICHSYCDRIGGKIGYSARLISSLHLSYTSASLTIVQKSAKKLTHAAFRKLCRISYTKSIDCSLFHMMGRLGQPHEVGNVVAFLLSDEASYIHGAVISIDGGSAAL